MEIFLEGVSQGHVFEFFMASLNGLKISEGDFTQNFFCFLSCTSEEMNEIFMLTLTLLFKNWGLSGVEDQ